MKTGTLLKTGIACSCLSGLCCVTPALVFLLGAVGLSAAVGYLDYVLMPAFAFSVALTVYALILRRRRHDRS